MQAYGGADVQNHIFLTSTLAGGVVSFTLLQLYLRGKSPQYSFDRRLGGTRAGLDDMEKRKF
jgi:hypothetical protein